MNFNKYKLISNQFDVCFEKLNLRKNLKRLLLKKNTAILKY